MSNIPLARSLIETVLANEGFSREGRVQLRRALRLMKRRPYIRLVPRRKRPIGKEMKRRILRLANTTTLTQHEIATAVGLRSSGRISEVLHGKR